jgi:DNA-binding MarR family transcriptional regulator
MSLDLIIETMIYLETESRRLAKEASQRAGVTATQLNVLKLLTEIGALSLTEISRRLAAQNSTVTGIIDRMVAAGLVTREQSAEDRRVWRIRATAKGEEVIEGVKILPWDLLRSALGALDKREKDQLVTILKKVAAHVAGSINTKEGNSKEVRNGSRG